MKNSLETGYKIQAHVDLLKCFQKSYNSMKSSTFDKIFKIISISKIFSRMWSVLTGFFLRFVSSTVDFHKFCYVISILHDFTNTGTSNILLKLHRFWISFGRSLFWSWSYIRKSREKFERYIICEITPRFVRIGFFLTRTLTQLFLESQLIWIKSRPVETRRSEKLKRLVQAFC